MGGLWVAVTALVVVVLVWCLSDQRRARRLRYERRVHEARAAGDPADTIEVYVVVPCQGLATARRREAWGRCLWSLFHGATCPPRLHVTLVADTTQDLRPLFAVATMLARQSDETDWASAGHHVTVQTVGPPVAADAAGPDRLRRIVRGLRAATPPARVHVLVAPTDPVEFADSWDAALLARLAPSAEARHLTETARGDGMPTFLRVVNCTDPLFQLPVLGGEPLARAPTSRPLPTAFWCPDFYATTDGPQQLLGRLPDPATAPPLTWIWETILRFGAAAAADPLFQPGVPLLRRQQGTSLRRAEQRWRRRLRSRLVAEHEAYREVRERVRRLRCDAWTTSPAFEARSGMRCRPAPHRDAQPTTEIFGQAFLGIVDVGAPLEIQGKYGSTAAFQRARHAATSSQDG